MHRFIALPCLLALTAPVAAETGKTYTELSGIYTFISDSGFEVNPSAAKLTLGREFTDWLAAEAFIGTGLIDDNTNVLGANVNVEVDRLYGAHLRPFYRTSDGYEIFARAGYFHGRLSGSAVGPGGSAVFFAQDGSFSFGAGAAFPIGQSTKLTLDWMRYYQGSGTTINGIGAGIRVHF